MKNSFTLIELLVTISILIFLTFLSAPAVRGSLETFALLRSTQMIISALRQAQSWSMGLKQYNQYTPRGYGLHLRPTNTIYFFAECDPNNQYTPGGGPCNNAPELIYSISLESGISIFSLSPNPPLNIIFLPPRGNTLINGSSNTSATITLRNSRNQEKRIIVEPNGLIYSQ